MSTAVLFSDAPTARRGTQVAYGDLDALTPLDRIVLDLTADGLTNPEIGARISRSATVVREHLERLGTVLGARERAAIVAQGYRKGLLYPPLPTPDGRGVLTRELFDLLLLVACGLSNPQIAERTGLSVDQVKSRLVKIARLLDARGREHAVRRAVERGVLRLVPRGSGL